MAEECVLVEIVEVKRSKGIPEREAREAPRRSRTLHQKAVTKERDLSGRELVPSDKCLLIGLT